MEKPKTHLIVTGVARSGTTALAELLNAHDDICLGVERFKFQFLLHGNFSKELFEKERFFDFQEADTNITPTAKPQWAPLYSEIGRKWDAAQVIGDKVPDMMPVLSDFLEANPDFKCIYILRNLKAVALSWQVRASDRLDSWPAGRGFDHACESWQKQAWELQELILSRKAKGRILLLDYDTMYDAESTAEEAILRFLDLGPGEAFSATFQRHAEFFRGRTKKRRRVPEQFKEVYNRTDKSAFRDLRRRSRLQMKKLVSIPAGVLTP